MCDYFSSSSNNCGCSAEPVAVEGDSHVFGLDVDLQAVLVHCSIFTNVAGVRQQELPLGRVDLGQVVVHGGLILECFGAGVARPNNFSVVSR